MARNSRRATILTWVAIIVVILFLGGCAYEFFTHLNGEQGDCLISWGREC